MMAHNFENELRFFPLVLLGLVSCHVAQFLLPPHSPPVLQGSLLYAARSLTYIYYIGLVILQLAP